MHVSMKGTWVKAHCGLSVLRAISKVFQLKTVCGLSVLTSVFTVVEWKCFEVYHLCSHQSSRLLSENALWSIYTHISVQGCWVKMLCGLSVLTSVFKVVKWKCSVVYLYSHQWWRLLSENALWSICTHISVEGCWVKMLCGLSVLTSVLKVVEWKCSVVYLYSHKCWRLLSENALWSICTHISVEGCWVKMLCGLSVLASVLKVVEWKCHVAYHLHSHQCQMFLSENFLWSVMYPHNNIQGTWVKTLPHLCLCPRSIVLLHGEGAGCNRLVRLFTKLY